MSVPYDYKRCGGTFYGPAWNDDAEAPLCEGCNEAKELRAMLRACLDFIDGKPITFGPGRETTPTWADIRRAASEP